MAAGMSQRLKGTGYTRFWAGLLQAVGYFAGLERAFLSLIPTRLHVSVPSLSLLSFPNAHLARCLSRAAPTRVVEEEHAICLKLNHPRGSPRLWSQWGAGTLSPADLQHLCFAPQVYMFLVKWNDLSEKLIYRRFTEIYEFHVSRAGGRNGPRLLHRKHGVGENKRRANSR